MRIYSNTSLSELVVVVKHDFYQSTDESISLAKRLQDLLDLTTAQFESIVKCLAFGSVSLDTIINDLDMSPSDSRVVEEVVGRVINIRDTGVIPKGCHRYFAVNLNTGKTLLVRFRLTEFKYDWE